MNGLPQILNLLLLSPKLQTGLKVQVPSVSIWLFLTGDQSAQLATEAWSAAPTAQAPEWVGTTTEWC